MKRAIGSFITLAGVVGILYYGYVYLEDSESFNALGVDVAVSTGDYVPVLISVIVTILGILIYKMK